MTTRPKPNITNIRSSFIHTSRSFIFLLVPIMQSFYPGQIQNQQPKGTLFDNGGSGAAAAVGIIEGTNTSSDGEPGKKNVVSLTTSTTTLGKNDESDAASFFFLKNLDLDGGGSLEAFGLFGGLFPNFFFFFFFFF